VRATVGLVLITLLAGPPWRQKAFGALERRAEASPHKRHIIDPEHNALNAQSL